MTPEELLLGGGLAWIAGWLGWALRPRARERWLVVLVLAGAALLGGLGLREWYRRPLAIVLRRHPAHVTSRPRSRARAG